MSRFLSASTASLASAGAAQAFCIVPMASCQGGAYAVAAGGFHAR